MSKTEKKWIEFVEKHTGWVYMQGVYQDGEMENNFVMGGETVLPEDLLGWQIRFAEECGYLIHVIRLFDDKGYTYDGELIRNDQLIENIKFNKTYQDAFNSAWERFMELENDNRD